MSGAAPPQLALRQTVDEGLTAVEAAMRTVTASQVDVLRDASRHILGAGGKRMRPRLLLLSYLAMGGDDMSHAAKPAAAVELMHTASVVHDDINDHGVLRRGKPAVNAIWGRTFALLTGDFLFTAVYELMAPYGDLNIDLAQAATALVEGETLQASAVKNNHFNREVYGRIIALKTAALFRAAGAIGAKLAGAAQPETSALADFSFNLGLAFQIVDDILDLVADEAKLGKTSGIDIGQGRGFAVALSEGSSNGNAPPSDSLDSIKRRMLEGDTIDKARDRANLLVRSAIASLDILPHSPAKEALVELAQQVIARES
ncbi:MAG: polyprenyl synthetase family protein [Chloroflexi bacterium]|nr:polyprenyl synthetase family protein [Chloroflexota bacterium]MCY4246300.1 polyprenyl synthetase family protein [Chloroflexota bacterium]